MSSASLKRLEQKINTLTKLVKHIVNRDVADVPAAPDGNRTTRAALYLGLAPSTLAVWRTMNPTPGPRFTYEGTTPIYSRADLDEWLALRRATGRKREASRDVGRPAGTGKKRAGGAR